MATTNKVMATGLPYFNGSSWSLYAVQLKNSLVALGYWQVVCDNPAKRPPPLSAPPIAPRHPQPPPRADGNADNAPISAEALRTYELQVTQYRLDLANHTALQEKWTAYEEKEERALALILQHLSPNIQPLVQPCSTPYEAWCTLDDRFNAPTWGKLVLKLQEYYNVKMPEGGSVSNHLLHLTNLLQQLAALGKPIDEETQSIVLLNSLPKSYQSWISQLRSQQSGVRQGNPGVIVRRPTQGQWRDFSNPRPPQGFPFSYEHVCTQLQAEFDLRQGDASRQINQLGQSNPVSRPERPAKPATRPFGNANFSGTCHKCGKPSHWANNCLSARHNSGQFKRGSSNNNRHSFSRGRHHGNRGNNGSRGGGRAGRGGRGGSGRNRGRDNNRRDAHNNNGGRNERASTPTLEHHYMGLEEAAPSYHNYGHEINVIGLSDPPPSHQVWIGDSGATEHATPHRHNFISYALLDPPFQVKVANNSFMAAIGRGTVAIEVQRPEGGWTPVVLEEVLHIPALSANFFSLSTLDKQGAHITMTQGRLEISKGGNDPIVMHLQGKLYSIVARRIRSEGPAADALRAQGFTIREPSNVPQIHTSLAPGSLKHEAAHRQPRSEDVPCEVQVHGSTLDGRSALQAEAAISEPERAPDEEAASPTAPTSTNVPSPMDDLMLWHRRSGHQSARNVRVMARLVSGMPDIPSPSKHHPCHTCPSCNIGKQAKKTPGSRPSRATKPLELVHSDLCMMSHFSSARKRYFLSFIDDFTGMSWIYLLYSKDETFVFFLEWLPKVERESGAKLLTLRSDNGGEYINNEFDAFCLTRGITQDPGAPYSPELNGVAERLNRTLCDKVRAMLDDSGLPPKYWGEAVLTANQIRNLSPYAPLRGKVPLEAWTGRKPSVRFLRVFGCRVYVRSRDYTKKLEPRSQPCTLVGYNEGGRTYRVLTKTGALIVVAPQDCHFEEQTMGWNADDYEEEASEDVLLEALHPSRTSAPFPSISPTITGRVSSSVGGEGDSPAHSNTQPHRPQPHSESHPSQRGEHAQSEPRSLPNRRSERVPPRSGSKAQAHDARSGRQPHATTGPNDTRRSTTGTAARPPAQQPTSPRDTLRRMRPSGPYAATTSPLVLPRTAARQTTAVRTAPNPTPPSTSSSLPGITVGPKGTRKLAQITERPAQRLRVDHPTTPSTSTATTSTSDSDSEPPSPIPMVIGLPANASPSTSNESTSTPTINQLEEIVHQILLTSAQQQGLIEPTTYKEAINSPQAEDWIRAMDAEVDALEENHTWELVELPKSARPINCKWVYKIKVDKDGSVERYKARLVAKGFQQVEGRDYNEIFSPVARMSTIRTLIALATAYNLELDQMDVVTAFLNGDVEEHIYMRQPTGYEIEGKEHMVYKLKKALYGLKQAPRQWNIKLHNYLVDELGFSANHVDAALYTKWDGKQLLIICVYVDDLLVASNNRPKLNKLKANLAAGFKMKDLGPLSYYLGVEVIRDRVGGTTTLSQRAYALEVLKKFKMQDCRGVTTPAEPNIVLTKEMSPKTEKDEMAMRDVPYASCVGAIMYLSTCTRPDVTWALSKAAAFTAHPGPSHWKALKRILQYLKTTYNWSLTYRTGPSSAVLEVFTDADHNSCPETSRATSARVLMLAGAAIEWSSKKQGIATLSTLESEYVAMASACQTVVWARNLLKELGSPQKLPTPLWCDNQGAITVTRNPESHHRTKHIRLKYHFIKDCERLGDVKVQYVGTDEQIADSLTKALSAAAHAKCSQAQGLWPLE